MLEEKEFRDENKTQMLEKLEERRKTAQSLSRRKSTGISRRQSVKSIGNKSIKSGKSGKSVKSGKSGTTKVDVLKVGDTGLRTGFE